MMKRIVLARRPQGAPVDGDFRLEEQALPVPATGEVLVRVLTISLDPYMRGRMDDVKSYAKPVGLGETMEGGAVGEVIASNAIGFSEGDIVFGMFGWVTHGCLPAKDLRKIPPGVSPSTALGVLGMPGFTGWFGLNECGRPKSGETLVVGAATGAVGSMVGQLARLKGLRVVGVAGGPEKCKLAIDSLGFDDCIDHRAQVDAKAMRTALGRACPDGVDIYYENIGGKTLKAVLPLMNVGGRIAVCGMISWYDLGGLGAGDDASGPDQLPRVWRAILVKRLSVNGFIISDHFERLPEFLGQVAPLVANGSIAYSEDVAEGLENAPAAFMRMLKGGNFGKQVVRVS